MKATPPRILIVDDEESIHKALRLTLRNEPFELIDAYDAAEAIHLLERTDDVRGMICDHKMPGVTGVDLAVQVRLRFPEVGVLLLTGSGSLELAADAVNRGRVQGFLTKPWDPDDLCDTMRSLFLPEAGPRSPERQAEDVVARQLRDELEGVRDPETGAWIVSEDAA